MALATPLSGSSSYTRRKITPAAIRETAIGMKTISLNAVAHLMRSVITAKIKPSAVTMIGAAITQMRLFRMVLSMLPSVKIVM
jgi:hypothetical protein